MKKMLKILLAYLLHPDKASTLEFGKDFRQGGLTAMGGGMLGLVVSGDTITTGEALALLFLGMLLWSIGAMMTRTGHKMNPESGSDQRSKP